MQKIILLNLIKLLGQYDVDTLNDLEVGPNLNAYDLFENLVSIYHERDLGIPAPIDGDKFDAYIKTLIPNYKP